MLVRVHDLGTENIRCLVFGLRNDHRCKVRLEQNHVQTDQIDQRGEAKLTCLQYNIVIPERIKERLLRRSHPEWNILTVFVYYMIQVIQPPLLRPHYFTCHLPPSFLSIAPTTP